MNDRQIADLINELRDTAKDYAHTQQLRERLKHILLPHLWRLQTLEKQLQDVPINAARYVWLRSQHELADKDCDAEGFALPHVVPYCFTVFKPGIDESLEPVGCIPGELDEEIDNAMTAEKNAP